MNKIPFIVILSVISFSLTAQNLLDKKVDFEVENVTVDEALMILSEIGDVNIAFSTDFFDASKRISIDVKNASVEAVLREILSQTQIGYKVNGDRVLLFKKKPKRHTISGYIEDQESGERLIAATVYCPKQLKGTLTNEYGFFSLTLSAEQTIDLEYSYLGYEVKTTTVALNKNVQLNVQLKASLTLAEVIIEPNNEEEILLTKNDLQSMNLNKGFVEAIPSLGGTADPIRAAQNLAGVQGGIDGLGGVQVRGGDPGQNLMLLDGVPVYIPYHLMGIYSIYNPQAILDAKILKSTFSSRFGGRLSSVIDVRTREGNKYFWEGQAEANLIHTGFVVEGPIKKEKTSVLLAGRISPNGFLLAPTFERTYFVNRPGRINSNFYDLNAKVNHTISEKDKVYLSLFTGADLFYNEIYYEDEEFEYESFLEFDWRNTIGSIRWNHLFNDKLFLNTTITYSEYGFNYSVLEEYFEEDNQELYFINALSDNRDYGLKMDFDFLPNPNHTWRFGWGISDKEFIPDFTFFEEEDEELVGFEKYDIEGINDLIVSDSYHAISAFIYVEDELKINENINLNIGLRNSFFNHNGNDFINLEPRLSFNYKHSPKLEIFASANRMVQYLHLISNSALRLPNDIWLPSSEELLPQKSDQASLGMVFRPSSKSLFSIEGYYKKMINQYIYQDDIGPFIEELDDIYEPFNYLIKGEGKALGVETTIKLKTKKSGCLLSYTLAKNERQFEEQNLGNPYPHNYDQRHQIKTFLYHNFTENLQFSANWIYNSPNPQFSIISVDFQGLANIDLNEPGNKNNKRSIPYHHLDLNMTYLFSNKRFQHKLEFGIYNVYRRDNIAYNEVYIEVDEDEEQIAIDPIPSIPLLPSLNYSIRF